MSSVNATLANRQFCIDNKYNSKTYNENCWGLTACESPAGYRAYGDPPGYANHDGTVAFTAIGGSILFATKECISALRWIYENYKDKVWGRYGFVDSFNLDKDWYSDIVIGIDQGPILLMIENYLTGFVWRYFMRNRYIQRAMKLVGFEEGSKELIPEKPPLITAKYGKMKLSFDEKAEGEFWEMLPERTLEYGSLTKYPEDLSIKFKLSWDEEDLYLWAIVRDNEVIAKEEPKTLYKQDCIELFFAPEDTLLTWGNPQHFQLGFAPSGSKGQPVKYAWFQERDIKEIEFVARVLKDGYEMKVKIPFEVLGMEPAEGKRISFSIAVHDLDEKDNTPNCKLNLHFVPIYKEGTHRGFELAELKLVK